VTAYIYHFDPSKIEQMINVYKNLAMAGGFLYVAAFGAGLISVDATFKHGHAPRPAMAE
jgi:putative oxidoreductase